MKTKKLLLLMMVVPLWLFAQPAVWQNISGPSTVCKYETNLVYTVLFVKGVTYTWVVPKEANILYGQGSNIIIINWGSKKGSIDVAMHQAGEVEKKATLKIKIGECSAVAAVDTPEAGMTSARIYPNPFTEQFTVEFWSENENDLATLLVLDSNGVLKLSQELKVIEGKNVVQVTPPALLPGKYVVYIHYGAVVQKVRAIRM
jgi:hypothetical protein